MHSIFIRSLLAAGSVAALICPAPAHAQVAEEVQIELPAQDLAASLRDVSARTARNIIAPSELVRGRQAPALSGAYTAEDAVRMLLAGSGLEVRRVGEALIIQLADRTSLDGTAAAPSPTGEEATIIVTGTNIRGAQPTSPVITLRREEIQESGATSVEQLIGRLPQNAQSGVNRENFRVIGTGADVTEHGAGLNLRGLGQRGTLVLINGRRVAPSNTGLFVDVSLIPLGAIERVEILTDGASAIYGSDAVGGVVNFILRRDFEGAEATVQVGSATRGDGDVLQVGATAGTSWSSGGALLSYEYRDEDPILAADRDVTIGLSPATFLLPRERRHSVYGSLHQDLSADLRFELSGSYSQRDTARSYFFSGSPLPVDATQGAQALSGSAGLAYELGADWRVRVAGGYSVTTTDQEQVQIGGDGLVNGRATRNAIADVGVRADGPLFELPGGPVRVAFGVEGRREWYRDRFLTASADVPTEISRNVLGAFTEVQVPIVSSANRRSGVERLLVTAAGRLENYDNYGASFDPKIGLLWSPALGVAFRASYDTSFRAPLLSEASGTYSVLLVPTSALYIDPTEGSGVGVYMGGYNPEVQPERSRSWTFGAELTPARGLSLSLNYYSIRFANRIALPAQVFAVVGDPAYESVVTRGPSAAFVQSLIDNADLVLDITGPDFTDGGATASDVTVILDNRISNTALSATQGLDALLQYRFSVGQSEILLEANANYIFSFKDQFRLGSTIADVLDSPYRPLNFRSRAHVGWRRGGWSTNLFVNHADSYVDDRGGRSIPIRSYTTVDAGLAYEFGGEDAPSWLRDARVALQVDNLLDEQPPRLLTDPGSTTGFGYDPVNASARGRLISLQLRASW